MNLQAAAFYIQCLTSCSLLLLGHIFLSLGNTRESMNMVTPANKLASKIPDANVQLWASSILKVGFGFFQVLVSNCFLYFKIKIKTHLHLLITIPLVGLLILKFPFSLVLGYSANTCSYFICFPLMELVHKTHIAVPHYLSANLMQHGIIHKT